MNTRLGADRYQSRLSAILVFIRYATAIYLLLVAAVLFYGWLRKEIFLLFLVFAVLAPLGLLITAIYRLLWRQAIRAKTLKLAEVLENAARYLDNVPRRITRYDIDLFFKTTFVWHNVLSPFLSAITRLLVQAKYMIISENLGRGRDWSTDVSPGSPPAILAERTKSIARAMREQDPVAAFGALGELLALPILYGRQVHNGRAEFTDDDFIELCRKIAGLLRERKLLDADNLVRKLIGSLREIGSTDVVDVKWRALIAYWLWLRLAFLKTNPRPRPSRIWVGPSKLLAVQLDAALDAYKDQDFASLSEIVYESFDWRTRVPRFIL